MREILTKIRSVSLCASSPKKAAPLPSNSKNLASYHYPSIQKVSSSILSLFLSAHKCTTYAPSSIRVCAFWNLFLRKKKKKKKKTKKRETKKKKKKKLNHHHLHATIVEKDNYPHDENKKRPTIVRFPEIENSKNEASFDPPSNICQSFGTSSSEQCHLINICLLFSPSSLLET